MTDLDWSRWANFTREEMSCRCRCGGADMDPHFMDSLQALRETCNFPFPIVSGYRCPDHNEQVSTTGRNGPHTTGRAVDVLIAGERALTLVMYATGSGFRGLGVKQHGPHDKRFIHIDKVEGGKRPTVWSYY